MNRDEKAAAIEEVAGQIQGAQAVFALDYRGLTVPQAAELREKLNEADATLRVVKNRLTWRAADQVGAESLKVLLEGPTAFTFVRGDAALAAKAVAAFRKEHEVLAFKGGTLDGNDVSVDQIEAIAKLHTREVLDGQLVGILASPITGLVRGLSALIQGLALQLGQIAEQGLASGEAPAAARTEASDAAAAIDGAPAAEEVPAAEDAPAATEASPVDRGDGEQASGDQPAENDESDAPSEGEAKEG